MDQKTKKKLFISGPVSRKAYYWKDFEDARKYYTERGFAVMIPVRTSCRDAVRGLCKGVPGHDRQRR